MLRHLKNYIYKLESYFVKETVIKEDCAIKVVHLLRRDFNSQEQNDILLDIASKLSQLRDEDMVRMQKEYTKLQKDTLCLKSRLCTN